MGLLDKLFGASREAEEAITTLFPYTESEQSEREKWEEARRSARETWQEARRQIEAERAERKKGK